VNIYLVHSIDPLYVWDGGWAAATGGDPPEPYGIYERVAACTPSQARWLAWMSDARSEGGPLDMPRFSCKLQERGVALPSVVLGEPVPEEATTGEDG